MITEFLPEWDKRSLLVSVVLVVWVLGEMADMNGAWGNRDWRRDDLPELGGPRREIEREGRVAREGNVR